MRSGNIIKNHDSKLISILKHCSKTQQTNAVRVMFDDLSSFGLTEEQFIKAIERAEKTKLLCVVNSFSLEDATPEERISGNALVAIIAYYPKGRRRQKGPVKICAKPSFTKKKFVVCRDELHDVGIFYNKKRLYIGTLPDKLLAFLLENNGKSFTKNEIAERVFNTDTTGNLQAKIDKAADSGNVDEYMRLRKIQKGTK